jgi:hypothetical protein
MISAFDFSSSPKKGVLVARKKEPDKQVIGLLGVGLDNKDGHKRITRSDDFVVVGGSEETHEQMQDVVIRFEEYLKIRGKRLQDASEREVLDLLQEAMEKESN